MQEHQELNNRARQDVEEVLEKAGFGENRMISIFREAMSSFTVKFICQGPAYFGSIRTFISSREAKGAIAGAVICGVLTFALSLSDSSNYLHWIAVGFIAGGIAGNNYLST